MPTKKPSQIPEMHSQYSHKVPLKYRIRLGKFEKIISLLQEGKLDKKQIAGAAGEKEKRVRQIAEAFGFETGNETARRKSVAQRTETRMPAETEAYRQFRKTMPLKTAAAKAGIDPQVATRIDRARLTEQRRAEMKARLVSKARTSPVRPYIRRMLAIKNPDRSFRFPQSIIATAAGVSIMAVENANQFNENGANSRIRTHRDGIESRAKFNAIAKRPEERENLLREARMLFQTLSEKSGTGEKLRNLSEQEKADLKTALLSHNTLRMPRMKGDSQGDVSYIANSPERFTNRRAVMAALLGTPTFEISKASLLRHVPETHALETALNELGTKVGMGFIIRSTGTGSVKLNPDVVLLLEKGRI